MTTKMTIHGLGEVSDGDLFVLDMDALKKGHEEDIFHAYNFCDRCVQNGVDESSIIQFYWKSSHIIASDSYLLRKFGEEQIFWSGNADSEETVLHNFLKRKRDLENRKKPQKINRGW